MGLFVVTEGWGGLLVDKDTASSTILVSCTIVDASRCRHRLPFTRDMSSRSDNIALLVTASTGADPLARLGTGRGKRHLPFIKRMDVRGLVLAGDKTKREGPYRDQPYQNFSKSLCAHTGTSRPSVLSK